MALQHLLKFEQGVPTACRLGALHGALGQAKSDQIGHETSDLVVHFPSLPRRNRVLGYPEGIGGATKLRIFLEGLDPANLEF